MSDNHHIPYFQVASNAFEFAFDLSPETSEALKIGHFSHLNNVRQMLLPAHSRVWE